VIKNINNLEVFKIYMKEKKNFILDLLKEELTTIKKLKKKRDKYL